MTITAIIIQARMSSTRLPGKVMLPLCGVPVIRMVAERCMCSARVDTVAIAVPLDENTDAIKSEAFAAQVDTFIRGEHHDVLKRYTFAANHLNADVIVRVTADCPFIEPEVIDDLIRLRAHHNAPYASNVHPRSWPKGLDCEVFTREMLIRADQAAKSPEEREHVTPWIIANSPRLNLPAPMLGLSNRRWTLDTPEDYAHLTALAEGLHPDSTWREVLAVENRILGGELARSG
jgi:spore coat polysaccharide biosynthesis protein SpsF